MRVFWRENGLRRSKKFKTKDEADLFRLQLKLGVADKTPSGKLSPTFDEFASRWLKDYCMVEKAESQWREDESVIRNHLSPAFGTIRLNVLRKSHLMDLKASLASKTHRGKKLKPKTINNVVSLAKKIMSTALDYELVAKNPFVSVKLLRIPEREFLFWTIEERDTFIEKMKLVDHDIADLVLTASNTGLRHGELWALQRRDLDFKSRKIRVAASYSRKLAKRIETTKNKTWSWVPMNQAVYDCMLPRRFLKEGAQIFPDHLFLNSHRWLKKYSKAIGVTEIRFHDLRHTFASHLAMAGVDLFLIQKLMRHQSYQMTLKYAHLHPSHLKGATEVLCGTHLTPEKSAVL